jgi:SNF2 family DNA or RNA helicase
MLYVVAGERPPVQVEETVPEDEVNEKFSKLKNLEILLKSKKDAKILIFSNFDNTFHKVIPILNSLHIRYDYIKGNGDQIKAIVNRYKNGPLDLLLVNTKNYGTGMNLENTTDIIMFHKFDTQLESQVIGRAQRYGRTCSLKVHYLLHENEIKT